MLQTGCLIRAFFFFSNIRLANNLISHHATATGFTPLQQLTGLACDFCSKDVFALLVTGRRTGFRER